MTETLFPISGACLLAFARNCPRKQFLIPLACPHRDTPTPAQAQAEEQAKFLKVEQRKKAKAAEKKDQ
jgi:hypothetical protein